MRSAMRKEGNAKKLGGKRGRDGDRTGLKSQSVVRDRQRVKKEELKRVFIREGLGPKGN